MKTKLHREKKTYLLPQGLINEMKKTFGTRTETEAIINAMEEVSFRRKLVQWHEKNRGSFKIDNVYGR